jgi:hypothetical protein
MRKALVYSVPGTGTRFTKEFLESCLGYRAVPVKEILGKPVKSRCYANHHVDASFYSFTAHHQELRTIVPLRSPVAMFLTRRVDMGGGERSRTHAKCFWAKLKESLHRYNHVFLPIEEKFDREGKLLRVIKHLEAGIADPETFRRLCKSWGKVGSSGQKKERLDYDAHGNVEVDGRDMSFLDDEMSWYRGLIETYGGAI